MRLGVQISGNVGDILEAERRKGARAAKTVMGSVANEIKMAWRAQVGAAFGTRLANTIRSQAYPRSGNSLGAAAMVWTRAPKILAAFERGAVIRARNGLFLAVPLPAAGSGPGGQRLTPAEWERRRGIKLRFLARPGLPPLLVAHVRLNKRGLGVEARARYGRGRRVVPIFVLLPQVTLRKRLDLLNTAQRLARNIPARVVGAWN